MFRNLRALSKLWLILLLLSTAIVGALLSYLWVEGYYFGLGLKLPEKANLSVVNVSFNPQDTRIFNVTLLNPSFSPTDAVCTGIATLTADGVLHREVDVNPRPPIVIPVAEEFLFVCGWNWANHTGQQLSIVVFVENGYGPTFSAEIPLVQLGVTHVNFNSTISVNHFNITVQNYETSAAYVNITRITLTEENGAELNMTETIPLLPQTLTPGESVNFTCMWDWIDHQNKSLTLAVHTLQGYVAYSGGLTPLPVTLEIIDIIFDVKDTNSFRLTVVNNETSPTHVNIEKIIVQVENVAVQEWTGENGTDVNPNLPYALNSSSSQVFLCPWQWSDYRGSNVTVTVETLQGFTVNRTQATPLPVILEITDVSFNPLNTDKFTFTAQNSEFSISEARITEVAVTVENGLLQNITLTEVTPSLPWVINWNESAQFECKWNWAEYSGKNVTVVVQTSQGYHAYSPKVALSALTITEVLFNPVDRTHFIVTVLNPTSLDFKVVTMNVALENASPVNLTAFPTLPFNLPPGTNATFICSWDWDPYWGRDVTIGVYTLEGSSAHYTKNIAHMVVLTISEVLFDVLDTEHFNITVRNSELSTTYVSIRRIVVTLENGTVQEIGEVDPLVAPPYVLNPNASITFTCVWNWTDYQGDEVKLTVYTLRGYEATLTVKIP